MGHISQGLVSLGKALGFVYTCDEKLLQHFKQGSHLINLYFEKCTLVDGRRLDLAEKSECRPVNEIGLFPRGQARIVCAPEVSQATSPQISPWSFPNRPRLSYMALVKATVICLLEALFGTCGEELTDMVKSVSFLVLAILKVTFGKSEKFESISNLVATPSSCFVN